MGIFDPHRKPGKFRFEEDVRRRYIDREGDAIGIKGDAYLGLRFVVAIPELAEVLIV